LAHSSEGSRPLRPQALRIGQLADLRQVEPHAGAVHLLWLPAGRTDADIQANAGAVRLLVDWSSGLDENATVCVLTTPEDAALLLPYLEQHLTFHLWIALKIAPGAARDGRGQIPRRHAALLVMTRYRGSLRHTKTRIQYSCCPACGRTTKDYGGKKHIYHEYGTLMADVWRDIECDPQRDIAVVIERLRDMFGLPPYSRLDVVDLRSCQELAPSNEPRPGTEGSPRASTGCRGSVPVTGLVNADCLDILPCMPENSVDFCFSDPPYNVQKAYDRWQDALGTVEYFEWCDRWLYELSRVLKPGGTLAVLNIPRWAACHYQYLASIMEFQAWIAWEGLSLPVRMIMPAHYTILCFSKGPARQVPGLVRADLSCLERDCVAPLAEWYCRRSSCSARRRHSGLTDQCGITDLWHDIHRLKHNSRRVDHPCQLPPPLMRRLLALFTHPGEVVLDPFNGAGTTSIVAEQMGRKYIGIELSSEYHRLALARHEQLRAGVDPFAKVDHVPKAKNSRVQRLPKQNYEVSKKLLQLDVRRIARQLGHLPTRDEVEALGNYPIEYFDNYFIGWGEVCAAARTTGMSEHPRGRSPAPGQPRLPLDDIE
jgi:hypothetical protein